MPIHENKEGLELLKPVAMEKAGYTVKLKLLSFEASAFLLYTINISKRSLRADKSNGGENPSGGAPTPESSMDTFNPIEANFTHN
ncbi:hypothetical protein MLD38_020338 [Melastoma candidum]|uniref:Uncharacterized protein n=1 Tax=Melastoma candidum TaxID=119954 RepID=A0ACB9QCW9_9MYRT|nr:hypothetical protein MLD38_020338 [Melastoma candidum]